MRTLLRCSAVLAIALMSVTASGNGVSGSDRVPAARIAQHAVCRALLAADGTAEVICYLVFVEGLSGSLFSDSSKPPGEATARLTLRTDRISAQPFVNGNIIVFLQSGATYDLYFDNEPRGDRTWDSPATFSSGAVSQRSRERHRS
jgi:hypothetical protein